MPALFPTLEPTDEVVETESGLAITRKVTFLVCRCRQCNDSCKRLSIQYTLCAYCNNNHTQYVDRHYCGPHTGRRKEIL